MSYTISRNGSNLGAFPEEELRDGVTTGRFAASDLIWREGMAEWGTLGNVLGLPASTMPPPLPPMTASSVMPPPVFQSQPPQARRDIGDDAGMRLLLPVGRSGWAIAAGYMGLFSLLGFPAPFAIVVSIIALRDIKKSKEPGRKVKHGTGRAIFGLVAGIAGCVPIVMFAVLMWNRAHS